MLINIDIEVWMVILDWLGKGYRRELAAKVNQLGDRTFCGICQTWLHKYMKNVQLGTLYIESEVVFNKDGKAEQNGVLKVYDADRKVRVPFADVQMPENVTGFDYILISYLDSGVLNFLRLMPALVSSNHTKKILIIEPKAHEYDPDPGDEELAITRTALGHLLPLFSNGSLTSISLTSSLLGPIMDQCPEQLFSAKFLRLKDVTLPIIPSIVRWLCTERADAEPRLADVFDIRNLDYTTIMVHIYEAIRQQFLAATSPVCFYIDYTWDGTEGYQYQETHENRTTGEQLIWRSSSSSSNWSIGRCPLGADGETWMEEMGNKTWLFSLFILDQSS